MVLFLDEFSIHIVLLDYRPKRDYIQHNFPTTHDLKSNPYHKAVSCINNVVRLHMKRTICVGPLDLTYNLCYNINEQIFCEQKPLISQNITPSPITISI